MTESLQHHELTAYEQARKYSVHEKIHEDDFIFNFLRNHHNFPTYQSAVEYYFRDGSLSCARLNALLADHLALDGIPDLLEFACGYGMVTRHLAKEEGINLWSCDIHPAAVEFLRDEMRVRALLSARLPELLLLPQSFDVVFVLSLFTHLPITTWCRWLLRLTQAARPHGLIIFTTHGRLSREILGNPDVPDLGFWFRPMSEQKDLSGEDYGSTLTTEAFVRKNVLTIPDVELIDWKEGFWWGHQDVYVLRKH